MKNHKKTLFGSLFAFLVGTSCCWIASFIFWLGGAVITSTVATYIKSAQAFFIAASILLALASVIVFFKNRRKKQAKNVME